MKKTTLLTTAIFSLVIASTLLASSAAKAYGARCYESEAKQACLTWHAASFPPTVQSDDPQLQVVNEQLVRQDNGSPIVFMSVSYKGQVICQDMGVNAFLENYGQFTCSAFCNSSNRNPSDCVQ